jgi:hypothetical protein
MLAFAFALTYPASQSDKCVEQVLGTNFCAIIDHGLSQSEITSFDRALQLEWKNDASPLRGVDPMPGRAEWRWQLLTDAATPEEEYRAEGFLEFEGPAELHGSLYPCGLDIGSAIRWGTFLADYETQLSLCQAVRRIASMARGCTIIYLPDSIIGGCALDILHEAGDIDAVLACLARDLGQPAPHFEALAQVWAADGDGYAYLVEYLTT